MSVYSTFFAAGPVSSAYRMKNLTYKTRSEFITSFQQIPASTLILDISISDLQERPAGLLMEVFSMLSGIQELDLSFNCLGDSVLANDLPHIVSKIAHVRRLNLKGNFLGSKTAADLAQLLGIFKHNAEFEFLGLAANELNECPVHVLADVFRNLPAHIKELDLSENAFEEKSVSELNDLFSVLPSCLKKINFSGNFFSEAQQACLKKCLQQVDELVFDPQEDFAVNTFDDFCPFFRA